MTKKVVFSKSVSENQLRAIGTMDSANFLETAVRELPDHALDGLATELDFHDRTGLIGVHMSRLIMLLSEKNPEQFA